MIVIVNSNCLLEHIGPTDHSIAKMVYQSRYDSDEERLPEGMERIGYDADTETYTYRDADGSIVGVNFYANEPHFYRKQEASELLF